MTKSTNHGFMIVFILVLAHMVNLNEDIDISLLASTHTSVAHNLCSNLKLASGVAQASPGYAFSAIAG